MRVLYYTDCFPDEYANSSGVFCYYRAASLVKKGISVDVLKPNNVIGRSLKINYRKPFTTKELGYDIPIEVSWVNNVVTFKRLNISFMNPAVCRFVRSKGYDVIHVHFVWNSSPVLYVKKRLGVPFVLTCHGSDIHSIPQTSPEKMRDTLRALNGADAVIFVSHYLKQKALELGYGGANSFVVSNGVDTSIFNLGERKKPCLKVGFVGNLIPVKRVHLLPRIFSMVHKAIIGATFEFIGDGVLRSAIEKECAALKIPVFFTGVLGHRDVASRMRTMGVLVLPSLNEGFGCVALEAQACGASVVGSSNGGLPEAVGEGGAIIPEGDRFEERFADAVIHFLRYPLDPIRLTDGVQQYSWDTTVEMELEIYRDIIDRKGHC